MALVRGPEVALTQSLKVDFFTRDPATKEFVLYLVEVGPWSEELDKRLHAIQERIYGAFDVVVDGHLVKAHPTAAGGPVRIQVDLRDDAPQEVFELVERMAAYVAESAEYRDSVLRSPHAEGVRILARAKS